MRPRICFRQTDRNIQTLRLTCCALQGTGYDPGADVTFHDPMTDPLPYAPSLKMFCVYGVNKPVERCALGHAAMITSTQPAGARQTTVS